MGWDLELCVCCLWTFILKSFPFHFCGFQNTDVEDIYLANDCDYNLTYFYDIPLSVLVTCAVYSRLVPIITMFF